MSSTIETRARLLPIVAWLDRRTRRQRRFAIGLLCILAALYGLRILARVIVDRWWYDSVTDAPVWSTRVSAQLQLGAVSVLVAGAALGASIWFGLRTTDPNDVPASPVIRWYRARTGPGHRWLVVALGVWLSWRLVSGAVGYWQQWLLFRKGGSVGSTAPELGWDIGYYLFKLPFLSGFLGWTRLLVLLALGLAAFAYAVSGALRLPVDGRRSSPTAIRHLSAMVALLALNQAALYVLVRRPQLALNRDGAFDGAGYVQLRIVAPGLWVLAVTAIVVAAIFALAPRRNGWRLPAVAAGLGLVLHVGVLVVLPAVVQRLVVAPAEADRELAYIAHNLEATRAVYGLDDVRVARDTVADGIAAMPSGTDAEAVARVPVFTMNQLTGALQVLQGTTATRITDVDLDRYTVGDTRRPVMIAARNASRGDLPENGWVQSHLVYTHGDGVVLVPADAPDVDGRPDPNALASLQPADAALYYGEGLGGWYAIVGTRRQEQNGTVYGIDNGIDLGSTARRLVVATAFGEIEPLLSSELTSSSQLLYRRGLTERIKAIAPFLSLDGDPYPVIIDDHVVWVVDAYTTSSTYPYAQFASAAGLPPTSGLTRTPFNYLRASVKITVDGRTGATAFYRLDNTADDVILDAWSDILPNLLEPASGMPEALRDHLRYAPDAFTVQANLLGRYHVDNAELVFNGSQRWVVSRAAGDSVGSSPAAPASFVSLFLPEAPGDVSGQWAKMQTYSPGAASNAASGRDELAAVLVASNDELGQLELIDLTPSTGRQLSSPQVAQSAIDADPELARVFTLLNANGSKVQFGPMTPLMIDDGLVWIRSVVVSGTAATTAPRVYGVLAVSNGLVGQGPDAATALARAVGAGEGG